MMLKRATSTFMLAICATRAYAGGFELSDVIAKFGGQFSEAGVWVQTVFAFLGFCLVGIGIWKLAIVRGEQSNGPANTDWRFSPGLISLVCGAFFVDHGGRD
ncbi:hypothetical protein [Marinobacterium sp. BA1]|uniref:hypothetical protein n=1 Tax=Marinobacterium sp. BA1 TaxID=3138931 RepID=UPI0032E71C00